MKFASVRLITDDVDRLVTFYELITGLTFNRPVPLFGELITDAGTLAIGSSTTIPLFPGSGLQAADNRSAIIEFQVDDVDADYERIRSEVDVVQEPTTMPWGNRAMLLIDPDGNRINLYTPPLLKPGKGSAAAPDQRTGGTSIKSASSRKDATAAALPAGPKIQPCSGPAGGQPPVRRRPGLNRRGAARKPVLGTGCEPKRSIRGPNPSFHVAPTDRSHALAREAERPRPIPLTVDYVWMNGRLAHGRVLTGLEPVGTAELLAQNMSSSGCRGPRITAQT